MKVLYELHDENLGNDDDEMSHTVVTVQFSDIHVKIHTQ